MDSLTQMALGSAVGYAVMGPKIGRKAILWGAALGTLPDLDVFIPFEDEVKAFTYHRGFSHSLIVHLLITPLLAWLAIKIHPDTREDRNRWLAMIFLVLGTHAILDALTVYGTQLFWPLTEHPFGYANLFIIDPLVTLPLLVGIIWVLWPGVERLRATRVMNIALGVSCAYILWSVGAKFYIDQRIYTAFEERGINPTHYVSTPAPFTTLLWRSVAVEEQQYYEVYASLFDSTDQISIDAYPRYPELLTDVQSEWGVERLRWFTKGIYSVKPLESDIILSDLRMGVECAYVFSFKVGQQTADGVEPGSYERYRQPRSLRDVGTVFDRILDPSVSLAPDASLTRQC